MARREIVGAEYTDGERGGSIRGMRYLYQQRVGRVVIGIYTKRSV
jgi:hypothetical protein